MRNGQVQGALAQVESAGGETSGRSPGECEDAVPPCSSTSEAAAGPARGDGAQDSGGSGAEEVPLSRRATSKKLHAIADETAVMRGMFDEGRETLQMTIHLARDSLEPPQIPKCLASALECLCGADHDAFAMLETLKDWCAADPVTREAVRAHVLALEGQLQDRGLHKTQRQRIKNDIKKAQAVADASARLVKDFRRDAAVFERRRTVSGPPRMASFNPAHKSHM